MEDYLATASQFINTTSSHIFLTGKAGTGKTTFLKNLSKLTHKAHIVVAPTGIAALNAGGVTIHSQFLLPPVTFLPDRFLPEDFSENGRVINQNTLARKHPLNSARKQVLRSIDLLVIDEVSMLRSDLLDAIDYRMKAARGNFRQSFGGAQVLFIGDLFQLPPIVKNEEKDLLSKYYKSAWFYEAKALQDDPLIYIELDKIFRQSDNTFISILNNLRNNETTVEDIESLNLHYQPEDEIRKLNEIITLTTHNYKADEINLRELKNLTAKSYFFDAHLEGDFPESMYPVQLSLELKVGTQIMFVRNDNEGKMYFNGKLATITEISGDAIWVELAESHTRYQLKRERWENKKYSTHDGSELHEEVIGAFEQYPVKLAWAITVHKSQGLTFDKAIIDVGQAFADGQVYVALSRLRSLHGLVLRTKINSSAISTDAQVVSFVKNNHHPSQLNGLMKERQRYFIKQLLEKTFDFTSIVKDIRYIQKENPEDGFTEKSMKPILTQLIEQLEAEQTNTEKFRRQLIELLEGNKQESLLERIRKGSEYYKNHLWLNLKLLLHHIEVMKNQKRVKTYLNHLADIDQSLTKKLEEVDKSVYLIEAILNNSEKFEFVSLAQNRISERNKLLADIKKEVGNQIPPVIKPKTKKGKTKTADGKSTFDITLELLKSGMTVELIAKERDLAVGTIESHLAKAVAEDKLSIFEFMSKESVDTIGNALAELPENATSKELYDILKGKFGYGHLRAVMAHKRSEK